MGAAAANIPTHVVHAAVIADDPRGDSADDPAHVEQRRQIGAESGPHRGCNKLLKGGEVGRRNSLEAFT
jgi:hypothetical protein